MVAVTEMSTLLATKPATEGAPIGSGDWQLHVERLVGNVAGAVWDLDVWDAEAGTPGFVTLPGVSGNYLSVPDAAEFDIVGNLTIVVHATANDWTPAAQQCLFGKWGAAGQRSYRLLLLSTGVLRFEWSADGTAVLPADSTVAPTVTDGAPLWMQVHLEVNNGLAGRNIRFFTSTNGVNWVPLGTTVTQAGVTSVFASTAALECGSSVGGTVDLFAGLMDNVWLFAGLDIFGASTLIPGGVLRFQIDDADWAASPFTTASGHTATLNTSGVTPATITAAAGVDISEWALLLWESLNRFVRGMEWFRGADQPNGRPRVGEIRVTLGPSNSPGDHDAFVASCDPWGGNYENTRSGVVMRAGITSATDVRAGGWLPQWAGLVETWNVRYVGARSSGNAADRIVEVTLTETLSALARIDDNAMALAGAGDTLTTRIDRLLSAAAWPFGLVELFGAAPATTLQSTDMSLNRLAELYLTADSTVDGLVRSDVTGAALVADRSTIHASRLLEFSKTNFGFGDVPLVILSGDDLFEPPAWTIAYDPDSFEPANDPEGIVNDHRYARAGGTQQIVENVVSVGQFGRSTRARNDLLCQNDTQVLAVATADNNREARTALRVEAVEVVATGKPNVLLAVAAADIGDSAWIFPPAASGFTGSGVGFIRSATHTLTPLKGRVHWAVSYAVDFYSFNNMPGVLLPPVSEL